MPRRIGDDVRRGMRPQLPRALRVAAAWGHLPRCASSTMRSGIDSSARLAAGPTALATRPTRILGRAPRQPVVKVRASVPLALALCLPAAVSVFQPYDIIEFRGRDLDDVAVLDRRHSMHGAGRDVTPVARRHFPSRQSVALLDLEGDPARPQQNRLIFPLVILQAYGVAGVHVDDLTDVPIGLGPVHFVSPGFFDTRRFIAHQRLPSRVIRSGPFRRQLRLGRASRWTPRTRAEGRLRWLPQR